MSHQRDACWICANCGARHKTNDEPCRECASEKFARLEEPKTQRVERTESISWKCKDCGEVSPQNQTACNNCGGFRYEKVNMEAGGHQPNHTEDPAQTVTAWSVLAYLVGGFALFSALGAAINAAYPTTILLILSGAVAMPYSRRNIEQSFQVTLSTGATVLLVVVLYLFGIWLAGPHV